MKWLLMALCLSAIVSCASVKQNNPNVPIGNFYQVDGDPSIYRGAQPDHAGMLWLANNGVKSIINLNDDKNSAAQEAADARALGLNDIQIPLASFSTPSDQDMAAIETALNNGPVFIHCLHGEDRTGLSIGLHRVKTDGWDATKAHDEMLKYGFHTILVPLENYFWEHTGVVPEFHN